MTVPSASPDTPDAPGGGGSGTTGPAPLTRREVFTEAVNSLPEPLRGLLAALEPHVAPRGGGSPLRAVYVPVRLALDAFGDGDVFAAHFLLQQATYAAPAPDPLDAELDETETAVPAPGGLWVPPKPAPPPRYRVRLHAFVPGIPPADGPVYAATDAGWRGLGFGYGYVVSTGLWGLHGGALVARNAAEDRRVETATIHELRAVAHLMGWLTKHLPKETEVVLLCDNLDAQRYLREWQKGGTPRFPRGEAALATRNAKTRPLEWLARRMREVPNVRVKDVAGHSGHLLNEAADSLATLGRRHAEGEQIDVLGRAADIADSFLRAWAAGDESRFGGRVRSGHRFPPATPVSKAM